MRGARRQRLCIILLALAAGGCGVTSIHVPVDRPAEIYLRKYNTVLLHTNEHPADGRHDFPIGLIAEVIDAETQARFAAAGAPNLIAASRLRDAPSHETDVPVSRYPSLVGETGADCLLQWHILECRYQQGIQSAEVRQSDAPASVKNVRKGLLLLKALVSATDLRERSRFWEDTVETVASTQSKASPAEPEQVDSLALLRSAIGSLVADISRRATPSREFAVVSFLRDGDFPDVSKGIRAAERGDWKAAVTIFTLIDRQAAGTEVEHKMLHNLGMAQLYHGDYRTAYDSFQAAFRLKQDKRYEHAMQRVLDMERESQERIRQQSR
jgi:hypothetical protein